MFCCQFWFIFHYTLHDFIVIFAESLPGLIRLQQLFDAIFISDLDVEVKVYEVASNSTVVYEHLITIDQTYQSGIKPMLLDLPNDLSDEVLKRQDRERWQLGFHYVFIGLVREGYRNSFKLGY